MANIFEQLFRKIKDLPINDKKSDAFNIFKVLGIENKEVLTCRLLGELMNPHGAHGLGEKPLQLFLQIIGITSDDLKSAAVVLEETIDDDRRVDIVIYIKDFVVPIEVKIWADDQNKQLHDYYQYFKNRKYNENDLIIYYLTPNGREPSEFSKIGLGEECYKCISFEKDISIWLEEILKELNNDISATDKERIKMILEQFQEVIKDMCAKETNLQNIKEAIDFREGEFNPNDSMKALLYILEANQENKLWKSVRNEYLRQNLIVDSKKYELVDAVEIPEGQKGDCVFSIKSEKSGNIIAWICIETNLYIVAEKIKKDNQISWRGSEGYYWIYISPEGNGKKFSLKEPNPNILEGNKSIDIESLLEQIEE